MSDIPNLEQRLRELAAAPDEANWDDVLRRTGQRPAMLGFSRPTRLVLAGAVVIALGAAAAILTVGLGGSARPGSGGNAGAVGPTGPQGPPGPTVDYPLAGGGEASLADAKAALGAPLVLPDTSPMGSPDPGPVWLSSDPLETIAAVTYPKARLWIDYWTGANVYNDDVLQLYNGIAHDSPGFRVIDIDGIPALAISEDSAGTNPGSVMFQVSGLRVTIIGHQDDSTVLALARSIINGYAAPPVGQLGEVGGIQLFTYFPPGRQIDLADASGTLGAPVVLPDTSLASPSNAGPAWAERSCPASDGSITEESFRHACWIWISFPSAGLSVGYLRPPQYRGTRGEWELQAGKYGDNAKVIELGNIPALAIEPQDPYPGSVEFDLDGTRVVVAGAYDTATLQDVAQSIVDRAGG